MNDRGIKQIIEYIAHNCKTTITPKQWEQLREMEHINKYDIRNLRKLYRIAIDNCVYPECPYCKKSITNQEDLTIDHIIPHALGGKDDIENLQPMHKKCNSEKGCAMPELKQCTKSQPKKHHKNHHGGKRETVKSHTVEELYTKCQKIDQARTDKCRIIYLVRSK